MLIFVTGTEVPSPFVQSGLIGNKGSLCAATAHAACWDQSSVQFWFAHAAVISASRKNGYVCVVKWIADGVPVFQKRKWVGSVVDVPKLPNCNITLWFHDPVPSLQAVGLHAANDSVVIIGGVELKPSAL